MRFNARHATWAFALAVAVTVVGTPKLGAAYQSEQGLEHGQGHDKNKNDKNRDTDNSNYRLGWDHGQEDRTNNRARQYRSRPDNDADRNAYESGYNQGYQNGGRQYGQNDRAGTGQSGNVQYGRYGGEAGRIGYQDGMNDGQTDRRTGHSNRPTQGDNYKHASRGYNSSFGSLSQYKAAYRQAYLQAYPQGYQQGYDRGYRR